MDVTVVICTWNRADLLDRTLDEMTRLAVPPGLTWELLVVNNNCADHTDAVAARYAARLPLRLLHQHIPGKSHAANLALDEARGDLIVWTDDDVLVSPGWLAEYAAAAARFPDAAYFGGTVDPWFQADPPDWVRQNMDRLCGPFAVRQLGPDTRYLARGEDVFGANMAFRTALQRAFRFDPRFGPLKDGKVYGEETELQARMRAAGHRGVWVGAARVRHWIPAERLTRRFMRRYFEGGGQSGERQKPYATPAAPRLLGVPRWMIRRYLLAELRRAALSPFGGPGWVEAFIEAADYRGRMRECRSAALAG